MQFVDMIISNTNTNKPQTTGNAHRKAGKSVNFNTVSTENVEKTF